MPFPDYYKILELEKNAEPEQIWLSYHKYKFLHYYNHQTDTPEVEEAYFVLIHPELRSEYDKIFEREKFLRLPLMWRRRLFAFLTGLFSSLAIGLSLLLTHH